MKAVIYTRISADKGQASPETQEADCHEWAEAEGWTVVETFGPEVESGGIDHDRPILEKAVEAAEASRYEALIVWHPDRFGRGMDSALAWLRLRRAGVHVHDQTSRRQLSEADFAGTLADAIKERERIRTLRGKKEAARLGHWNGGEEPYGTRHVPCDRHDHDPKDNAKMLVLDETEAAVLREVWSWIVEERVSAYEAADRLNKRGVRTRRGKRWSDANLRRILRSERLVGVSTWGSQEVDVPQIFSPGQHSVLVEALKRNSRPRDNGDRTYPLSGKVWCGCGAKWIGVSPKGKRHYRCQRKAECPWPDRKYIVADKLETVVLRILEEQIFPSKEELYASAHDYLTVEQEVDPKAVAKVRRRVTRLEGEYASALRAQFGDFDPQAAKAALTEVDEELREARATLRELEQQEARAILPDDWWNAPEVQELVDRLYDLLGKGDLERLADVLWLVVRWTGRDEIDLEATLQVGPDLVEAALEASGDLS